MARKARTIPPSDWRLITDTGELAAFCRRQAAADFVTVDTEFMRDRTFWSQLCLMQAAGPAEAVVIDPLADGIELAPFFELLANPAVLKVFHAARQDIEIFFDLGQVIPRPLFDTQVAAMVCGFGESAGYETLVAKLAGGQIDKTSRFANWAQRPLSERHLHYAVADVTYLRPVYKRLRQWLDESGRASWLEEEMAILTDPATYRVDPRTAWTRLKPRSGDPRFLAVLRELAAWREAEAMRRDLPRGRILRDDSLMDVAAHAPETVDKLARCRAITRGYAEGRAGREILAAIACGLAVPASQCPMPAAKPLRRPGIGPTVELLRVLLKHKCEAEHVAQKLVASTDDLELIASDDAAEVAALKGWRRALFGADALALKHGRLALTVRDGTIDVIYAAAARQPIGERAARAGRRKTAARPG
jgi:ribonuclease D